ncbi:MAG: type II toxin-antitoxin system VapC family toxin [Caldilineales bacterium]|nr:type II toxin-antitoxin system VapC family toxin [Caldilineales bacterium]
MIVLDTHILIWDALSPERLSSSAQIAISEANQTDGISICDISLWEIAMLIQKGRVRVNADSQTFINLALQANKSSVQAITPQIASLAVQLGDEINRDPADRLIVATALALDIPLVTADKNLQAAKIVNTIW